eukprot:3094017-Pyramimonas_sp.AAC.1
MLCDTHHRVHDVGERVNVDPVPLDHGAALEHLEALLVRLRSERLLRLRQPLQHRVHRVPGVRPVGAHTAIKPSFSRSTTGEFNSSPNYSRTVSTTRT